MLEDLFVQNDLSERIFGFDTPPLDDTDTV